LDTKSEGTRGRSCITVNADSTWANVAAKPATCGGTASVRGSAVDVCSKENLPAIREIPRHAPGPGLVLRSRTNLQGEELSDDELMEAVVNREPAALEAIFNRYRSMLRTIILGVVRDEADVDDVLSEVFLQIWERGDQYISNENGLQSLLITVARRRAFDRLRRRAAYRRATEGLKTDAENPLTQEMVHYSDRAEIQDLSEFLQGVLRELPAARKEVIDLAFFEGMSQREIASKRQIPLGTVKTRLHLARRKLYDYLLPLQGKI